MKTPSLLARAQPYTMGGLFEEFHYKKVRLIFNDAEDAFYSKEDLLKIPCSSCANYRCRSKLKACNPLKLSWNPNNEGFLRSIRPAYACTQPIKMEITQQIQKTNTKTLHLCQTSRSSSHALTFRCNDESGISLGSFQFNILRSPGLDSRHELRGRLHKIKPDIEFDALTTSNSEQNHNHYQHHHHHHCHHTQRCHQLEQPLQQQYYQQLAPRQSNNQYQSKLSVSIECEQQQQQQQQHHEVTPFETYEQERQITAEVSNKNSSITLNNHLNEHHWQHDNVKLDQSPTTTYNSQEVTALQSASTATASSHSANNSDLINPSSAVSVSTSPAIDIDNFSNIYNTDNPYEVPDSYTAAATAITKNTSTPIIGKEYSFDTKNKESFCHHVYYNLDDSCQRPVLWEDISNSIQNIDPENVLILEQHSNSSQLQQLQQNFSGSTINNVNVLVPQVKMETIDDTLPESLSASLINPLEIKKEILTKPNRNTDSPHSQCFPQLPAPVSPRSGQINVYHYSNNQQQQQRLYQSHRNLNDRDIFILEQQQQQQQQANITNALRSNSNSPNQSNRCHSTASSHNSETNYTPNTNSVNLLSFSPDNSMYNQSIYLQKQQQQQQQHRLLNQNLNDPTTTYDNNNHTLQVKALTINSSNLAMDNNSKNLNNNNYPWHSSQKSKIKEK
ncbi:hypothetical protein GQX74_003673 [Glossina fuscipes]|nr:hypothetical protein GQX74_003673 [Glossina fuscipes]